MHMVVLKVKNTVTEVVGRGLPPDSRKFTLSLNK